MCGWAWEGDFSGRVSGSGHGGVTRCPTVWRWRHAQGRRSVCVRQWQLLRYPAPEHLGCHMMRICPVCRAEVRGNACPLHNVASIEVEHATIPLDGVPDFAGPADEGAMSGCRLPRRWEIVCPLTVEYGRDSDRSWTREQTPIPVSSSGTPSCPVPSKPA